MARTPLAMFDWGNAARDQSEPFDGWEDWERQMEERCIQIATPLILGSSVQLGGYGRARQIVMRIAAVGVAPGTAVSEEHKLSAIFLDRLRERPARDARSRSRRNEIRTEC